MTFTPPSADNLVHLTKSLTLDDDNSASDVDACFTLTGTVRLSKLYLEVTGGTTLTNATAVYFDLYSANGATALTKSDGALSGKNLGFIMYKKDVLTVTGAYMDPSAAPVVTEEATTDLNIMHECYCTQDATAGPAWRQPSGCTTPRATPPRPTTRP